MAVWVASVLYSAPKFIWVNTIVHETNNRNETYCIADRRKFNSEVFDMINFALLYVIPLAVMSVS